MQAERPVHLGRYHIVCDMGKHRAQEQNLQYELIHGLEEAGCELPGEIYVSGYKESQTQKELFTYQFMLNRYFGFLSRPGK